MPVWIPRWVFVSLTGAAAVVAMAVGYRTDSEHLRSSQERDLTRLASGLRTALSSTEALQSLSVRPPRISADGDTLEFTIPRSVLMGGATPPTWGFFWDSLCLERLSDPAGREAQRRLGLVPARLWVLERVRVYVDKERGGLWRAGGDEGPMMLAPEVDALVITADAEVGRDRGILIELAGTWHVDTATAIRRKLYRYLPAQEAVNG